MPRKVPQCARCSARNTIEAGRCGKCGCPEKNAGWACNRCNLVTREPRHPGYCTHCGCPEHRMLYDTDPELAPMQTLTKLSVPEQGSLPPDGHYTQGCQEPSMSGQLTAAPTPGQPRVRVEGDRLSIHFDRFDLPTYDLFLRAKALPEYAVAYHEHDATYTLTAPARFAAMLGVAERSTPATALPLSPFLFDDQAAITRMFLAAQRFAVWSDCGLGKTLIGLEGARHVLHKTGGRALITTRNEIVGQWVDEAARFYGDSLPIVRLHTRAEMKRWCKEGPGNLAVTNYEKWNPEGRDDQVVQEARDLALIILDEGSRLRTAGGRQKWALIKTFEHTQFKLILTATPAPNDWHEYMSQAGFLNKFRAEQSINAFFTRDNKTHRWTVKPHARGALFRFLADWSIFVRDPRRYGWRRQMAEVPAPTWHIHPIEPTPEQLDQLLLASADARGQLSLCGPAETNTIERAKLSQVAKGFRYQPDGTARPIPSRKPGVVADLVRAEVDAGLQVLVWTVFDAEAAILADELHRRGLAFGLLEGATKAKERTRIITDFKAGHLPVLVSKPAILGYGMNLQCAGAMVLSGWTDSFEDLYQLLRRAVRYGQERSVRIHVPIIRELEGDTWDNLHRKQAAHEAGIAEMETAYLEANRALKGGAA